ncbi:MAG: peptidoglycan DD-metalloendopeptidase family protein [Clostridiales bacterium]|nr:peptidoglycan DD-metalloendopeptidase family protein [Clostridiales bacterium]
MKNKGSGDSIFKKKGFFISLYSCLGAVVVLALVISLTNLLPPSQSNESAQEQNDSVNVNAGQDESYLVKAEAEANGELADNEEAFWKKPAPTPVPTQRPVVRPTAPGTPAAPQTRPAEPPASPPVSPQPNQPGAPASQQAAPVTAVGSELQRQAAQPLSEADSGVAFEPFSEDDSMVWPVDGEIAMDFNTDELVYDPTLDQYRVNDDLRITAQEGTPVKAGAGGQVVSIGNNHVYGNYVAIDHGNGLTATYGQLMDGILVEEGDVVKPGQVIGGVGQPSPYGSLNGPHVNLRVTLNDEPIDPKNILADASIPEE